MRLAAVLVLSAAAFAEDPAYDIAEVLAKIKSGSPSECAEAIAKLPPGKEERAAGPIALRLKSETDAQARAALRDALSFYSAAALAKALKAPLDAKGVTDEFRLVALDLLRPYKTAATADLVVDIAFTSEMKATRGAAQKVLVDYGDLSVKGTSAYVRADPSLAREAIAVLKAIDSEPAAKALVHFLVSGSEKEILRIAGVGEAIRDEIAKAVIEMGDEAAPALIAGLDSSNHQKWCSYCLQKISGEFHTMKDKAAWLDWWKRRQAEKAGR